MEAGNSRAPREGDLRGNARSQSCARIESRARSAGPAPATHGVDIITRHYPSRDHARLALVGGRQRGPHTPSRHPGKDLIQLMLNEYIFVYPDAFPARSVITRMSYLLKKTPEFILSFS